MHLYAGRGNKFCVLDKARAAGGITMDADNFDEVRAKSNPLDWLSWQIRKLPSVLHMKKT